MEGFILPSQLALLVYGYLVEEDCTAAAKSFVETSTYTKEARQYVAKGHVFNTKLNGLGLTDIIEILGEVVCYVKSLECSRPVTLEEALRQLRSILKLRSDEGNAQKPVYLRFTMEQSPQKKTPRKNKPAETNSTPKSSKSSPETISPKLDGSAVIPSTSKLQQQFHVLLENRALHEKLAENINKVVANKSDVESLESVLQKRIVETIINDTEQDPFFQEMLEELIASQNPKIITGPAEASRTPEDNKNKTDANGMNSNCTLSGGFVGDPYIRNQCQEPTNAEGQSSQLTSSQTAQTPSSRMVVHTSLDKSELPHGQNQFTPLIAQQPVLPPMDVQTVMAASTISIPSTTQVPSSYLIASSQGTAVLNSLVTPKVVIGTTFSGTALKFTPACPMNPVVRQAGPPRHNPLAPPPPSVIQVFTGATRSSSLPKVLPKPTPQAVPGGVLAQPIKQVPTTQQGNQHPSPSLQQNPVVTVSLAPSASPVVSKSVPSPIVTRGARTRGGKGKSYGGRKKIVQTISPSATKVDNSSAFRTVLVESEVDVADGGENSKPPVEKAVESVGAAPNHKLSACKAVSDSLVNDNAETPVSKLFPVGSDSVPETVNSDADVTKINEMPKLVAAVAELAVEIPMSIVEVKKPGNEDAKNNADSLSNSISTQYLSSQEIANSDVSQSEANPVVRGSSSRGASTCRPEATPQQDSEPKVKLRKRLSLSTPRRGSHIRTLEFKTPPKNSTGPRKSLSSPKNKAPETARLPEMQKMLESVRKSELFKSPLKKEKKSWDADLRQYTTEEDIPTSVGLKRKSSVASRTRNAIKSNESMNTVKCAKGGSNSAEESSALVSTAQSNGKSENVAVDTTPEKKAESDDDLISRIQREVLDVIGEEDVAELSSQSSYINKSCDSGTPKCSPNPKLVKSPMRSPGTSSVLEIGDIGLSASTIKKLYRRNASIDENSCTMDSPLSKALKDSLSSPKRSKIEASKGRLFTSPARPTVDRAKASTPTLDLEYQLQLSPSPHQLKTDLGSTPPPKAGSLSERSRTPGSGSLEATLIKECHRIEKEGVETARQVKTSYEKSCDAAPKVFSNSDTSSGVAINTHLKAKTDAEKTENPVVSNMPLPPIGTARLKTPGKTLLSTSIGITPLKTQGEPLTSAPFEMTPLSKIINEETRLGKCTLLTPTIPPTPDYEEVKNKEPPTGDAESPPNALDSQFKTQSPPEPVRTSSPSKKILKTPSKTPSMTPVVKLKEKQAEKAAKPRKQKSQKELVKNETAKLIAELVAQAKEGISYQAAGSKKTRQNDVTHNPVTDEIPQKKKNPKRKNKEQKSCKVIPDKEFASDSKLPHFQELLESYENSKFDSPSSSEDERVPASAYLKRIFVETSKTPKKISTRGTKKPPKKLPKEKGTSKKTGTKTKNKLVHRKELVGESTERKEIIIANVKGSGKAGETAGKGSVWLKPEPTVDSKMNSGVSKNSASSKRPEEPVSWVSESSQDICIWSLNESKLGEVSPVSPVSRKINEQPALESVTDTSLLFVPSSPGMGSGFSLGANNHTRNVNLDDFAMKVSVTIDDVPSERNIFCSPYFSIFEYPLPKNILPNNSMLESSQTRRCCQRNEEDLLSQKSNTLSDNHNKLGKVEEDIRRGPRLSRSCSRNEEGALLQKTSTDRTIRAEEEKDKEKKRLRKSRSRSSSKEVEPSQKPQKIWGHNDNVDDTRIQRRSRSRNSVEDEKAHKKSGKPGKSSNVGNFIVKEVTDSSNRRRGRSRSRSLIEEQKPPHIPAKSSSVSTTKAEEGVDTTKRRRRRSRSSSGSEVGTSSWKPSKPWHDSHLKSEEERGTNKRRWRRSWSRSSSEEDRSRKRRKTGERRDVTWPRYRRDAYKGFRGRSAGSGRSPHVRTHSHRRSYRYSSSDDDERGRKKPHSKLPYSGNRERGRDRSKSRSRDYEDHWPKKDQGDLRRHQEDPKRHRDDSKQHDDSGKHHAGSKKRHDDLNKHLEDPTRCEESSKTRNQEPKDDTARSDRRETTRKPTSNHLESPLNRVEEPSPIAKQTQKSGNDAKKPPSNLKRTPVGDLEEGEISEESSNTIFQFSKNNSHSGGGATDRLSSPVASASRQKLLKNVNVDKFLSLVHGDAKSSLKK